MNKKVFAISAIATICLGTMSNIVFPTRDAEATSAEPQYSAEVLQSQTSWTIDELKFFSKIAEQELEDHCRDAEDSWDCQMSYSFERREKNKIYDAVEEFDMQRIFITAINPSTQTIKVVYKDENGGFERMMGIRSREDIDSLYLARFNKGYVTYDLLHSIQAESDPGSHAVFAGASSTLGIGWLKPNIESELAATNLYDDPNIDDILYYAVIDASGSMSLGSYDYTSCTKSSEYQFGYECRLIYKDNWWTYIPIDPNAKEPAIEDLTEELDDKDSTSAEAEHNDATTNLDVKQSNDDATEYIENRQTTENIIEDSAQTDNVDIEVSPAATGHLISTEKTINHTEYGTSDDDTEYVDNNVADQTVAATNLRGMQDYSHSYETDDLGIPNLGDDQHEPIMWWVLALIVASIIALLIWWFLPVRKHKKS